MASGSSRDKKARSVFVGNIPYDATEQQLTALFSTAGPVVSFRLVSDRDTGRPKGFGFCEFRDKDTAHSAIRNLNGHDFNGRSLRVHYADDQGRAGGPSSRMGGPGAQEQQAPQSSIEQASAIINGLTQAQQLQILSEMKRFAEDRPDQARDVLAEHPQLAQALLQIQVLFGLVRDADIAALQRPPARAPVPVGRGPPASSAPATLDEIPAEHRESLKQVLKLTAEEISQLPADYQDQVRKLQNQYPQFLRK